MSSGQSARRRGLDLEQFAGVIVIGLMVSLVYIVFFDSPHVSNLWSSVVEAYPGGSMECHVSVMDRARHISDLLRGSQYVSDVPFEYQASDLADELALRMVVEAEWQPPECAGGRP